MSVQEIVGQVNRAIDPKKMSKEEAYDFVTELIDELDILRDSLKPEPEHA